MPIRIPRTAVSRRERTYAQLILSVPRRRGVNVFRGIYFRTGALVEESQLRPTPDYPEIPILVEFAGSDHSGWGHNRSNDIHIVWRWDAARQEWMEVARMVSQGAEWFGNLAPLVERLMVVPRFSVPERAHEVAERVLALLDSEMDLLGEEAREAVLSVLHDQFTARLFDAAA